MSIFKSIWKNNSKHTKLSEPKCEGELIEDMEGIECTPDTITFNVKYIGSTPVDRTGNETTTSESVKKILLAHKSATPKKKATRVKLIVGLQGIRVQEPDGEKDKLDHSIFRISYCSADAQNGRVFAYIATNSDSSMECHAFICPKRKDAQAITLSVAQVFTTAFETWRRGPVATSVDVIDEKPPKMVQESHQLIDLGDFSSPGFAEPFSNTPKNDWVRFDEDDFPRWTPTRQVNLVMS